MWCRAFAAAVALTYVICVLILNGVQKEDLDVNTLRKLQRHNVNIEDMNNEDLRKECLALNGQSKTEKKNTALQLLSPELSLDQRKAKMSDSILQNMLINYLYNSQKGNSDVEMDEKPRTDTLSIDNLNTILNNLSKSVNYEQTITTPTTTTMGSKREKNMEYINNILEKFLIFQKHTTTSKPTTTVIDYEYYAQRIKDMMLKKIIPLPKKPIQREKVNDDFRMLFNDSLKYMMENLHFSPLKLFGTTANKVNIENKISKDDHFLSQVNTLNTEAKEWSNIITNTEKSKEKSFSDISADIVKKISDALEVRGLKGIQLTKSTTTESNSQIKNIISDETQLLTAEIMKKISDNLEANLSNNLQVITSSTVEPNIKLRNDYKKDINTKLYDASIIQRISESIKLDVLRDIQEKMSTTIKPDISTTKYITKNPPTLTVDFIREISDQIKSKVLEDLHKSMTVMAEEPITQTIKEVNTEAYKEKPKLNTTIEHTTEQTPHQSKQKRPLYKKNNLVNGQPLENNPANVLAELMEMVRDYKANKEQSMMHRTETIGHPVYKQHTNAMDSKLAWTESYPLTEASIQRIYPEDKVQNVMDTPVIHPIKHHNIASSPSMNINAHNTQLKQTHYNIYNSREHNQLPPITIQTNSAEIQPINLPSAHSYVYQNIIVSSKRPLQMRNDIPSHPFKSNSQPKYHKPVPQLAKPDPFRSQHNSNTATTDEFRNYHFSRTNRYYDILTRRTPARYILDDKKVRFHEKLEKSENFDRHLWQREHGKHMEFSTPKVSSRLQIPLNRAPKKYESHFKNFMKTQQKVNDMLERILATKSVFNAEEAKSVETAR